MSEFLPVGYKLSKEREHARSEQAFGFAGPSEPRRQEANRPPPNIFVGLKAKTSASKGLGMLLFPSLGFSNRPTVLLCTVAVTVAGSQSVFLS